MSDISKFKELIEQIFNTLSPPTKLIEGNEVFNFDNVQEKIGVICLVFFEDKILLTERSGKVDSPSFWHPVSGYYDRFAEPDEMAKAELKEEVGFTITLVDKIKSLDTLELQVADIKWYIFPVIIQLDKLQDITLNEENTSARFVKIEELSKLKMLPEIVQLIQEEFETLSKETKENNLPH